MKDEPIDVLDEQGNKTGQILMKSEAHAQSLWHPVAHLWIYNSKGQVLLQKRAPNKIVWPNVWDVAVAGHITAGDSPAATILREAKEELNLTFKPSEIELFDLSKFEDQMPDNWFNRVYIYSYIALKDVEVKDLILEEDETSDVRWVGVSALDKELDDPKMQHHFSPPAKKFFRTAIKEIKKRI